MWMETFIDLVAHELAGLAVILVLLILFCRVFHGRIFVPKLWFVILMPALFFTVNDYRKESNRRKEMFDYIARQLDAGKSVKVYIDGTDEYVNDAEIVEHGFLNKNLYRFRVRGGGTRLVMANRMYCEDFYDNMK